jgi:uncharacterized protein YaiI (UPF0178 family)
MKILVDADACPKSVLKACLRVGRKYNIPVWTVASYHHNIESDHHVVVGSDPQETDIKVINLTQEDDVVVTQDWGLAAVILGKGGRCLSPTGIEYRQDRIEFLLEEREIKAKIRRSGGKAKGPKKKMASDDRRFERCLEQILSQKPGSSPPS